MFFMKTRTLFKALFICLALTISAVSCSSTKEIPSDLTAPQLLQRGQHSIDTAEYKMAERYFLKAIELYGEDPNTYIEARYELAHLYMKQKKYDKAYVILDEILEIYDNSVTGTLPAAYKKLAQLDMSKIPAAKLEELENQKNH